MFSGGTELKDWLRREKWWSGLGRKLFLSLRAFGKFEVELDKVRVVL